MEEQKIAPAKFGDIVSVHFTCKFENGTIYDSSRGKVPIEVTIGSYSLLEGFERSIIGMSPGETKTTLVKAADTHGAYNKDMIKAINRSEFPGDIHPEIGLQIQIQRKDGGKSFVTVTDVTETSITLDANHPLAGKDLIFEIELLGIIKPGASAASYYNLGVFFQGKGDSEEAAKCYKRAIAIQPDFIDSYFNLGVVAQTSGNIDEAESFYKKVIELNPDHEKAYLNLGIALKEKGRHEESQKCLTRAIDIKHDYDIAYYNLGNIFYYRGDFKAAKNYYRQAISITADYADAHWNIALIDLLLGKYKEGWEGYEWRWKLGGITVKRDISRPLWDGSDINGKTIMIHTEQGFGDIIQFIRYIPLVAEKGAKVIVECQRELLSLLQDVEGIYKITDNNFQFQEYDLYCPLLTLPRIFDTTLENLPAKIPYITADISKVKKWRKIILPNRKLHIGLAWSGSFELIKSYYNRSCSLESFSPLAEFDDIAFYSLQKGTSSEQADNPPEGMELINFMDGIDDFSDTAALIENLDLVISVDTAVAHLAGAMGKAVWTLLPYVPDWRWMLDREDSPWYPTMKLFRQPKIGDWETAIKHVCEELKLLLQNP